MADKRSKYPRLENLLITDAGSEGKAVARHGEMVVFIPYGAPGDVVDVQVTKKKKNFAEGRIVQIRKASELRMQPFCVHFGLCGGCKWQHLSYEQQLKFKHKVVADSFIRMAKLDTPEIPPVLPSPDATKYRNKLEFTFSNRRWLTGDLDVPFDERNMNALGFHLPGMYDRVLDIEECHLQEDLSNRIRLSVKEYADGHGLSFFDTRNKAGLLRNLIIRNTTTGEWMVILVFSEDMPENLELLFHVRQEFPDLTSLMFMVNNKPNDSIFDLEARLYDGQPYITEVLDGLKFRIGPKSFFQTNSKQALYLYRTAMEFAALTGKENVYDLYTGTGTIANFIAGKAGRVTGIESVEAAVTDARLNSEINGISNTEFVTGDMMKVFSGGFLKAYGQPDVVITDPPRAGMHEKVVLNLLEASPERIVYISCNPATQARDIALMTGHYRITRMQPVDMFPHTHHIENIALLEKR